MDLIINFLGTIMGYIMYACYGLVHNYLIAIILFTLLVRIILLPVSIWLHKNSIKLVKMMPDINMIKARYYGNKDKISEQQMLLYKKEKYYPLADVIPLLLQVIILVGVVNVIYNPLTHILHIPSSQVDALVTTYANMEHVNLEQSGLQVMVAQDVIDGNHMEDYASFVPKDTIDIISDLNLKWNGFALATIPSKAFGKYILIPILAAICALLLCMAQNKVNVLQSEQGIFNKVGTTLLSVFLSLYLGYFVPVGVGFYWIFSNLFAILQLFLLNYFINPKKYIDYDALQQSKDVLEYMGGNKDEKKGKYQRDPYQKKCNEDYRRFIKAENKQLVFYSENKGFYKYYKDIIEEILHHSRIVIHYVTSDPEDTVFSLENDNFHVYYVNGRKLIYLMMKMDADVVVMTTPDLEKYHIKRSIIRNDIEYIYIPHGVNSANLTLRKNALDYFDTAYVANEIAIDEMRAVERFNEAPNKRLVKFGSSLIDDMITSYENFCVQNQKGDTKKILIAPSWQTDNIMDICIETLLDNIKNMDCQIVVRPHPQYVRHCSEQLKNLQKKYETCSNIEFQLDFSSNTVIYEADLLITDWSSIAFEYAFATLHPVLFINTPMKIMNLDYDQIDIVPIDIALRNEVGMSIELEHIDQIKEKVEELLTSSDYSQEKMEKIREQYLFNIGKSGKVGAAYLMKRLG
ncbi:MAG: membrane protein insertase YidC [Lachnospiraceae bacterium]